VISKLAVEKLDNVYENDIKEIETIKMNRKIISADRTQLKISQ
jgi:hypothetical protein